MSGSPEYGLGISRPSKTLSAETSRMRSPTPIFFFSSKSLILLEYIWHTWVSINFEYLHCAVVVYFREPREGIQEERLVERRVVEASGPVPVAADHRPVLEPYRIVGVKEGYCGRWSEMRCLVDRGCELWHRLDEFEVSVRIRLVERIWGIGRLTVCKR